MQQVTISTMPVFREKLVHTGSLEDRAGNKLETRLAEPTVITVDDEQITVQFVQVITPDGNAQTTEYYMLFDEATHELPLKIGEKFYNVTWIGEQYTLGDEITDSTPTDYLKMSDTALYHEGNWYQGLILVTGGEETVATRGNIYTLKDRLNVRYAPYVDGEPALVSDEPGATQYTRFLSELVLYSREHECTATVQMPLAELSRVTLKVNADGAVTTPEIASDSHFYKYSYYPTNYQSILPEDELDGATLLDGLAVSGKFKIGSVLNVDEFTVYFSNRLSEDYIIITLMYGTTKVGLLSGKFNEPVVYPTNIKLAGYIFKGYEAEKPTHFLTDCVVQCIFEKDESGGGDEPEPETGTLYKLYWVVESVQVKLDQLLAGTTITPPTADDFTPEEREGYTFAWGYYPETMPASNLIVNGVYAKDSDLDGEGKLTVTYKLKIFNTDLTTSEETYQTVKVLPGQFSPIAAPAERQGYEWQGWQNVPPTISENITIWGWFYQTGFVPDDPENPDKKQFNAIWKFVYPPTINYTLATQTYNYGDTITPPSVSLEGWVFDSWDEFPETMPAHDIEIGSSWHRYGTHDKSYEIKYELTTYNPGQAGVKETYYTEMVPWGETHTRIAAPTHPTLLFDGWYMWNAVGKVLVPESFVVTDDTLIWGKLWDDDTAEDIAGYRKIHFQYRLYPGHIPAWFHYCYRHFKPGDTITLPPDPTTSARPFHHDHWEGLPQDMIMPDEDLEVYSTFVRDAEAVKIIYRTKIHGDITSDAWTTVREDDVYAGSTYTIPTDYTPQLEGYVFGEWKTETFWTESGFKAYTAGTEFTVPYSDVIVDGEFYDANGTDRIPGRYFVHYQYRLYSGHIPPWFSIGYQWYKEGDTITPWQNPPVNPMRPNYAHDHWEGLPDPLVMPANDIEVYSTYVYVPPTHQVIYKSTILGDITDKTANIDYTDTAGAGTTVTIRTDRPTRQGYVFGEWYYSDLHGRHTSGQTFTMPDQDVTIYGHFYDEDSSENIPGMYKITYRYKLYNGHIPEWFLHCYQHYHEGDTIVLPTAPVSTARPQYVHDHWEGLPQDMKMPNHDLTASSTFVYQNGTYTVTYKSKVRGDLTSQTEVVEYTDTVTEGSTYTVRTTVPTRTGYIFGEWSIPIWTPPSYVEYKSGQSFTMPGDNLTATGYFYQDDTDSVIPGMYRINYRYKYYQGHIPEWFHYMYQHYNAGDTIVPPAGPDSFRQYAHDHWDGLPQDMIMPNHDLTVSSTYVYVGNTITIKYITKLYNDITTKTEVVEYTDTAVEGSTYTVRTNVPTRTGYIFGKWEVSLFRPPYYNTYYGGDSFVVPGEDLIVRGYFYLDDDDSQIPGKYIVHYKYRLYVGHIPAWFHYTYQHYNAGDTIVLPAAPQSVNRPQYVHDHWDGLPQDMIMPNHDIEVTSTFVYAPDGKTILYRSMNEGDITGDSYRTEFTDRAAPGSTYTIRRDIPTKSGYIFGQWYYDDLTGRHTSGDSITVPDQDIIIYGTFYKDDGSTPIPGYHQVEFIWRRAGQTEYYIGHTFAHFHTGDTITYPANPADFVQQGVTYRHVEWSNAPADGKMPDNDLVITSWMQPVKDTYTARYYAAWNNSSDGIGTQLFRTVDNIQEGSNMTLLAAMPAKTGYLSPGWTRVTYPNYNGNGIPFSYSLDPGTTTINIMKTVGGIIEIYSDLILDNTSDNIPGYRRVEFIWKREDDTSGYIGHMYKHFVPNSTIVFPSDPADYVYNGYTYRHVEWSNVPSGRVMPDDDIVITSNMAKQHPSYKAYYIARWDNDVDGQGTRLCGTYWATEGSNYTIRTDEPVKENYVFTQWEFSYFNGYEFATYVSGDTFVVPFTTTGAINIYGDFILDNQNINIPGYKKVTFIWGPEDNPSEEFGRKYAHFRPGRDIVAPIITNIEESETVYYQHKAWSNMPEFGVMPNEDIVITSYMIKHLRKYITVTYIVTTYNESEEVEKTETFTFREISGLAAVFYVVDAPEGYYFDEWDTTIEVWPEEDITINGSIKYGIPPKDRLYNLRYLVNGEVWRTQQYKYGEGILWPNMTPDVYRYAFNGWSVRPGTRMPMHDLDTNAILVYQDLVVTYYTVSTDSESYAQQFYYNTEPLKFPKDNPSFEAMTFARWNDQNGDPVEEGTEVTENLVLVAEFIDIPSITFYHPNANPVNKVLTEYYSPDIASRSVTISGMLSNREGYAVSRYQVKKPTESWD